MTDQRKTPRTDAARITAWGEEGIEGSIGLTAVSVDFSRTLELEAADLRERLADAKSGEQALLTCIQTACEALGEQVQPAFLPDLIEERLAKARAEAIEECARVCDEQEKQHQSTDQKAAIRFTGYAIRALSQKGADHE